MLQILYVHHLPFLLGHSNTGLQNITELKKLVADPKTEPELHELATEELSSTTDELQSVVLQLQSALVPPHPFASLPCLVELRPGAGGDEAALFAGDLFRMYTAYCKMQGMPFNILKMEIDASSSPKEAKIQEAVIEIGQENAYEHFRCEAGVHRVQRVPATETKGRTHTSAVSVLVLPSFPDRGNEEDEVNVDDPSSDYYVNPTDVKIETMRARGAGGQHVNMTDSAVRLTHLPTNTVVAMQDQRSQLKNREKAWQILRAKLAQARREAREEELAELRLGVVGVARMGRGDKIRTYNWSQQRVTDHRCGVSVYNLPDVLVGGGGLTTIMIGVKDWLKSRDLESLVQEENAIPSGDVIEQSGSS